MSDSVFHQLSRLLLCIFLNSANSRAQTSDKEIIRHNQTWLSFNASLRIKENWGFMGDFHVRREDFFKYDYFYFVRAGAIYWISGKYPVAIGYAHNWLAPQPGLNTWQNENRIFQQWSFSEKRQKTGIFCRIRTEERWRDEIVNDTYTGNTLYSFRFRVLNSFEFELFKDKNLPRFVFSDEVMVQFGHNIIYNTFDQNRLFFGFKVRLDESNSFDLGYMNVIQQRGNGYTYDMSHVIRFFYYYTPDFRKSVESPSESVYENTE